MIVHLQLHLIIAFGETRATDDWGKNHIKSNKHEEAPNSM
jgi:hypothetical protein